MQEYIYKKSDPAILPKVILKVLDEKGIDIGKLSLCIPFDRDENGMSRDVYLLCDGDGIYLLSGFVAVEKEGKKSTRKFVETSYRCYSLKDYKNFYVGENVSSLYLAAESENGITILSNSTMTRRREMNSAKQYLTSILESGTFTPMDESEEEQLFCPKCGNRYADPDSKICTNCMDRKKTLERTMELMKKYKKKIAAVIGMLILTGAISVITPYFSSGFLYDKVLEDTGSEFYGQITLVLSIVIGMKLISTIVSVFHNIVTSKIAAELVYDLKKIIFSSIQRLSVGFFTSRKTGGLMTQVSGDSNTIYWFFCDAVPYFTVNIAQIIAVAVIMFIMNPLLAALSLITFPFAFLSVSVLYKSMRKFHNRSFSKRRSMNSSLSDVLNGIRVVKAFAKEDDETSKFDYKSRASAMADKKARDFGSVAFPGVNFILYISNIIVWGVGGYMVIKGQYNMTYGILTTFITYMNMVYSPMFSLVNMVSQASDSMNAMGRLVEIMDAKPDVVESPNPVVIENFKGQVEFRNVSFGYDVGKTVLKNVSFKVEEGKALGIVGHTGAGKSTIANLLIRLYDTNEGGIYVDGVNVRDISLKQLHENTAIVSQETYLFIGTIYENIAYACPNASPEDVIYAAKIAGAHEFISKLPEGYETKIGFGYMNLSGGERQRISIARALLKNPKILILDEATAAMDTETERNIQTALSKLTKGRTTIMIAHRLSTLRDVDSLIVIEDGKLAEEGSHEKLIREKGIYYTLYCLQLAAMRNIAIEE